MLGRDWSDGGAAPLAAFRRRLDWAKRLAGLLTQHPGQGGEFAAQKKLIARDRQARSAATHSLRGLDHALQFAGSGLADLQCMLRFFYTAQRRCVVHCCSERKARSVVRSRANFSRRSGGQCPA